MIKKQGDKVLSTCTITPVQLRIGKLLAQGYDEMQIAKLMQVSRGVVKNQKAYAFEKTDSNSAAQFVYKLTKAGLI